MGFHLTPVAFHKWLKKKPADENVVVHSVEDPRRSDVVFVGAAQAIADALRQPDDAEFFGQAARLAATLPYLIEAITIGISGRSGTVSWNGL